MRKKKTPRGRPPISGVARDVMLRLRITRAEQKTLTNAAAQRGISVAELLMAPWRKE